MAHPVDTYNRASAAYAQDPSAANHAAYLRAQTAYHMWCDDDTYAPTGERRGDPDREDWHTD